MISVKIWAKGGWLLTPLLIFVSLTALAEPTPIIIDTDANNELDDQQAIAYVALNPAHFDLVGLTVNRTRNGGALGQHVEEAVRVLSMVQRYPEVPVYAGADGSYAQIQSTLSGLRHDGWQAVDFIVREARKPRQQKLVVAAIGKLTNVALALQKAPDIVSKIKVVWLGSNFPQAGEYNLVNDVSSVNPVLDSGVEFVLAVVRYGEPSGTDAVRMTVPQVRQRLAGAGPPLAAAVPGRNGGVFTSFGDYAVNLFEHIELYGDPPARALFDMAALAVLKNPRWASASQIAAPRLQEQAWVSDPQATHQITVWENFDRVAIINDFVESLE